MIVKQNSPSLEQVQGERDLKGKHLFHSGPVKSGGEQERIAAATNKQFLSS